MPGSGRNSRPARRTRPALLAASLTLLLAASCTRPPPEATPGVGTGPEASPAEVSSVLRVGIGRVTDLDPASIETPDALLVASQVFDGLVAYDPESGEVVPAAADRWEVLDGGRRFLFHLGEGRFHDGAPVTAHDFVRSWTRLVDPLAPRPFAFLLEAVLEFRRHRVSFGVNPFGGVRARSPRTLEVRLREPWPDFVAVLGHPALSPVPEGVGRAAFAARPVGNGPYRVAGDRTLGGPIRLVAAEHADAAVEAIEFRQFDRQRDAWPEFLIGELDVAPIPGALLAQAQAEFGSGGIQTLPRLVHCGFNLEEPFPQELRTAISLAIDRQAVVRATYGPLAEPADGIVPPTMPGSRSGACGEDCEHDPDRAAALLEDVPDLDRPFTLDVARTPVGGRLARAVADDLRAVGLRPRIRRHDADEYARVLRQGSHGLFCLVRTADYPRPQAMLEPLLRSDSQDNQTGLASRALDRLLARARSEPDPAEREELYVDAERRALALMPLVPVAWLRSNLAVQPYVDGFRLDHLGTFDAASLAIGG